MPECFKSELPFIKELIEDKIGVRFTDAKVVSSAESSVAIKMLNSIESEIGLTTVKR